MPVIEQGEGPTFTSNTVFLPTYAVMPYPRDEEGRRHWYAAAMVREYSACKEAGAPEKILSDFHAWIPDLWGLKLSPARVYQDGMDRMGRAGLSGCILLHLLRLAQYHPRHCKLERVKVLLASEPLELGVSESLIEKSWAGFQSVSHLWASLLYGKLPDNIVGWLNFLKQAEGFRRAGEAARLLSAENTWKPEAHYLYRDEAIIEPLEPDKIAFLDRQFPT